MKHVMLSAVALLTIAGCKKPTIPNPGDPCTVGDGIDEFCAADEKTLLKCLDGVFVAHHCSTCIQKFDAGVLETTSEMAKANCSLVNPASAKVGALCQEGSACEEGGKHTLKCIDKKMVAVSTCGGPNGCVYKEDEGKVSCDTSVNEVGAICREGSGSCSADGHALLICKDGHLVVGEECNGPQGACANINHNLGCTSAEAPAKQPPPKPKKRR